MTSNDHISAPTRFVEADGIRHASAEHAPSSEFLTPPIDREAEIRCYMRDPDGYLIEVGQATGILHGIHAKKRPEDLPG
jgi:catechol 2,3-dioxygenase-like lactoylglutathione lyase family enzyme